MRLFEDIVDKLHRKGSGTYCTRYQGSRIERYSNSQMCMDIEHFTDVLRRSGLRRGEIVALFFESRFEVFPLFVACLLFGAVPTILPPASPKQRTEKFQGELQKLLNRISPAVLVVSNASEPHVRSSKLLKYNLDNQQYQRSEEQCSSPNTLLPETAFVQQSSGTVSHKKSVEISHAAALNQLRGYGDAIGISGDDTIVTWLPYYHDMGLITGFLLPTFHQVPFVWIDTFEWVRNPWWFLEAISAHTGTLAWLPNFAFHHIAQTLPRELQCSLSSIRMIVNCSEPCRMQSFSIFYDSLKQFGLSKNSLQVSYAMAENVFAVTQTNIESPPRVEELSPGQWYLSCGKPINGTEIRIVPLVGSDAGQQQCYGEVWIHSNSRFSRYYQNDSNDTYADSDWFATSDIGCIISDELFVIGRKDDVIITAGRKFFAHEIESILGTMPGVKPGRVFAYGHYDETVGTSRLQIYFEGIDGVEDEIRATVTDICGFPPDRIIKVPSGTIQKSTSGKISRDETIMFLQGFIL